jgi:predicted MFS family arabinose efflux permease
MSTLNRNHDFAVLWIGQTVSELGSQMSMFAFPLLAYALTHSTLSAAVAEAAHLFGTSVALLPAGVLADRVHRGRLMRVASGSGVVLYASLVVAGMFGELTFAHLIVVAVLTGAGNGVFAPAEISAVRTVVPIEQLPTALSRNEARTHVASLAGGPLGGALYTITRWLPFLVDAVSYLISWVMLGRLRTDLAPAARPERRRPRQDIVEGLRFTWRHPFLRVLLIWSAAANLVVNALFMAAILRLIQGGFTPWSIGIVETALGICGLLGALVAPRIIARFATGRLTVAVAWSFAPLLVPLIFWNNPAVVVVALGAGIFLNPAGKAGIGSYRLAITPSELVGRVQSTSQFVGRSTLSVAPIIGGGLLTLLGGPSTMAILAVLIGVVALLPTLSNSVRSVPRPDEWTRPHAQERVPATV